MEDRVRRGLPFERRKRRARNASVSRLDNCPVRLPRVSMMSLAASTGRRTLGRLRSVLATSLLTTLAFALFVGREARAQEDTVVWYRSSNGCPSGAEFVERVERRGRVVRIAAVGDRVDFVVTLSSGEPSSTGRLERQTSDGVVAIRNVEGDTCSEVADALALSLALADEQRPTVPEPPVDESGGTPEEEIRASSLPLAPGSDSVAQPPSGTEAEPAFVSMEDHIRTPQPVSQPTLGPNSEGWFGFGVTGRTGLAPRGLWGGELHLERERTAVPWRVSAEFASGNHRDDLRVSIWAGRFDLCPAQIRRGSVALAWCGGLELGAMRARKGGSGGTKDGEVWAAALVRERLRWPADRSVAFEAELGLFAPFTPHRIVAEDRRLVLHRTDAVGLRSTIGIGFRMK